jgi:hypothetical protein
MNGPAAKGSVFSKELRQAAVWFQPVDTYQKEQCHVISMGDSCMTSGTHALYSVCPMKNVIF